MKGKGVFYPIPTSWSQTALFSVKSLGTHKPFTRLAVEKETEAGNVFHRLPPLLAGTCAWSRPCHRCCPRSQAFGKENGKPQETRRPPSRHPAWHRDVLSPRPARHIQTSCARPYSGSVTVLTRRVTRATRQDAAPALLGLESA